MAAAVDTARSWMDFMPATVSPHQPPPRAAVRVLSQSFTRPCTLWRPRYEGARPCNARALSRTPPSPVGVRAIELVRGRARELRDHRGGQARLPAPLYQPPDRLP